MFERLLIRNFQIHRKLEIAFGPGVTTILGRSDSGKSSVLRALRWVSTNKPKGDYFVSHGSKSCQVVLVVDGKEVERSKGKENLYRLDSAEYKAFANDVPEDISKLLAVCDLNFQSQLSSPYWLGDPAGKVSRELNEAVNLALIDDATARVHSIARKATTEEEICLDRIKEAEAELATLSHLDELEKDVSATETLERNLQSTRSRKGALSAILQEIDRVKESANRPIPDLVELDQLLQQLEVVRKRKKDLEDLLDGLASKKEQACQRKRRADAIGEELNQLASQGCPVCGKPNPQ